MTDRQPQTLGRDYHGATGPHRVPLKEAVWGFLVQLRWHGDQRYAAAVGHLVREAGLSAAEIDTLVAQTDGALADMSRQHRAWADEVCRERDRYRDRERLARSVDLAIARERRCRDRCLRGLREVLPRERRRRLLAWIANEWRSRVTMHDIDHGAHVRSVESIDEYLDRLCRGPS